MFISLSKRHLKAAIGIALVVLVDRLTKLFFLNGTNNHDFGWFAFTYVENTGASFGMLQGFSWLLIIIGMAALGLLAWFRKEVPLVPGVLVTGGIVGNLVDRLVLGYVIDFVDFKFFPVFNVADACITAGIGIWIVIVFFQKSGKDQNSSTSSNLSR